MPRAPSTFLAPQVPESRWEDDLAPSQIANAEDDEDVKEVVWSELNRLYGQDVVYTVGHPDGTTSIGERELIVEDLVLDGFYTVVSEPKEDADGFDYRILAYRDKETGGIAAIVTVAARSGIAAPAEYATYSRQQQPSQYPLLDEAAAAEALQATGVAAEKPTRLVFHPSPSSPKPELFAYEFQTPSGPRFVTQDRSVWTDLAELDRLDVPVTQ